MRRAGFAAAIALLGLALCAFILPYPLEGVRLALLGRYTAAGRGASSEFLAGDIRLRYRFPAYTGLEAQEIPASSGDIEAYPGTEVTIEVRAKKGADDAALRFEPGGERPMRKIGEGRFALTFTLDQAGAYRFVFDDEMDARAHPIKLRPDRLPSAFFSSPQSEIEVRENDVVTLRYRLEDDFGLREASLVFEYGAGKERLTKRLPLSRLSAAGKSLSAAYDWDLALTAFTPARSRQLLHRSQRQLHRPRPANGTLEHPNAEGLLRLRAPQKPLGKRGTALGGAARALGQVS